MASKKTMKSTSTTVNPANLRIYVKLDEAAQVMFNHQRQPNTVSFPAVVATVANMVKGGTLTGAQEDDKYVVVLTAEQLATVFEAAREYNSGRPATLETAKQAIATAEQAIAFAKANNSGLDLTEAETKLNSARTELKRLVFGHEKKSNFRPVVEMANAASSTAKQAVVDNLIQRAKTLAKETGTLDEFGQVLNDLPSDLDAARKALVEFIKAARQLRTPPVRSTTTAKPRNNGGHLTGRIGDGHVRFTGTGR